MSFGAQSASPFTGDGRSYGSMAYPRCLQLNGTHVFLVGGVAPTNTSTVVIAGSPVSSAEACLDSRCPLLRSARVHCRSAGGHCGAAHRRRLKLRTLGGTKPFVLLLLCFSRPCGAVLMGTSFHRLIVTCLCLADPPGCALHAAAAAADRRRRSVRSRRFSMRTPSAAFQSMRLDLAIAAECLLLLACCLPGANAGAQAASVLGRAPFCRPALTFTVPFLLTGWLPASFRPVHQSGLLHAVCRSAARQADAHSFLHCLGSSIASCR
jgi:hypothetical protein